MPYITKDKRPNLDKIVELMKEMNIKADGDLNYILFKYCKTCIPTSYNNYKNFCGELRECADEISRRLLALHEDNQIIKNGDV